VVDTSLRFPNGILTSRDEGVSAGWMASRRFIRQDELIGFSTENVMQYISNYFSPGGEADTSISSISNISIIDNISNISNLSGNCNPLLPKPTTTVSSHGPSPPPPMPLPLAADPRAVAMHSLLREVGVNPELMHLAQVPVNAAALCLIWEDEVG
jgi:hypothetical protein